MSGEGSLYKRTRTRPDGQEYVRWVAQASFGPRADRHVVRRVRRTKAEARAALAELLDPMVDGPTLGDYLRGWLAETASPSLAPNTVRGYRAVLAEWQPIADIPIARLEAEDIEASLNRMTSRRHLKDPETPPAAASAKTRRNALAMLRRALDMAVRRGHLERNVALLVEMPRVPRVAREAMTPEMARAILAAVKDDRYEAAYALALCGLRVGEVLGLAWADVDLEAGLAHVRWQLVGSGERAVRAQLKTRASEAPVPLPGFVVSRLVEHQRGQLLERIAAGVPTEEGLVFVTPSGWPVNATQLTKRFQALLAKAGLPSLRLHDLRHGAATLLAADGVHPRLAQQYLRHSQVGTTLSVYTHVAQGREREAADALERMVGG
jgi:integrase